MNTRTLHVSLHEVLDLIIFAEDSGAPDEVLEGLASLLNDELTDEEIRKYVGANSSEDEQYEAFSLHDKLLVFRMNHFKDVRRRCSVTHELMTEGWYSEPEEKYFKYEEDARAFCKKSGYSGLKEAHDEEFIYWTSVTNMRSKSFH